jgi:putative ribosome biogenesis GTPase RsgA
VRNWFSKLCFANATCAATQRADWEARLQQWGYRPRFVSVATGEGIDELEAELARGMTSDRQVEEDEEDEEVEEDEAEDEDNEDKHTDADKTDPTEATDTTDATGATDASDTTAATDTQTDTTGADTYKTGIGRGGGVTVLAGPSGVGKSSLINRLRAGSRLAEALTEAGEMDATSEDGKEEEGACGGESEGEGDEEEEENVEEEDDRRQYITDVDISGAGGGARDGFTAKGLDLQSVKSVSAKLGRGRHTTRHVTLLPLKSGGLLADTPGFGYPSLTTLTIAELGECFPEIRRAKRIQGACKFANCTHRDEPGCAVDEEMPWVRAGTFHTLSSVQQFYE